MSQDKPARSMRDMTVSRLAQAAGAALLHGDGNVRVSGITYDSREVRPGDLFAALPGSDFDGHRYIDSAIERGAAAILAERKIDTGVPVIEVGGSRASLALISAEFYGNPSRELTMIGLTGTDGKTTTSYMLRDMLERAGKQTGLIGTIGIALGDGTHVHLPHQTTPESNLVQRYLREMVDRKTDSAILEATSHGLHMHRLDQTVFTIAGVTNITHEHLEYHKTIDNYRLAKALLIRRVADERGVVVLNADDEGARSMEHHAAGAEVRWYSTQDAAADYYASGVVVGSNGSEFSLHVGRYQWHVSLPMLGEFNVANALCAIGVAQASGVEMGVILEALNQAAGVPGRMNRVDSGQPFSVVVDYAHTPESLRKILELLRRLHSERRLIVVSGSAGERDPGKRPLQGAVMAELADVSIVTSEDPRNEDPDQIISEIADGARAAGGVDGASLFTILDRRDAVRHAFGLAESDDCVLLAGKGHETSIIWGFEHRPWNEAEVAREELAALGYDVRCEASK